MIAMRLAALLLCLVLAPAAGAKTLRWSSQGDFLTADPHARNEGINNLINDEVYERLTSRAKDLSIIPALDRKSTRLNSSHIQKSRMPSSA